MSYTAKVRTGNNPIIVKINKPELICGAGKAFKLKKGAVASGESFEALIIPEADACCFLKEYANRRDLVLGFDSTNGAFVLYNPRHNTFRFVHLANGGYNLLSFIEQEFVTVKRS